MKDRLQTLIALAMVLIGIGCIVYAALSRLPADTAASDDNGQMDSRRDVPGREAPDDEQPVETPEGDAQTPETLQPAVPGADGENPEVDKSPTENGRHSDNPTPDVVRARREAVGLWLLYGLPLVFGALVIIIIVQRWFRPKPMPRTGPSDTTDLWQEAGKRLRL